jgi:threonine synthase
LGASIKSYKTESGGWFDELSDEEILKATSIGDVVKVFFVNLLRRPRLVVRFAILKVVKFLKALTIVCTLTGNGLKDPDTAIQQCTSTAELVTIDATLNQVRDSDFKVDGRLIRPNI